MWNDDNGTDYSGMHDAMNGGGWLVMLLVLLLLVGVGVVAVVALLRTRRDPTPRKEPKVLLAERYAKGELSDDEYAHKLEVLGSS